MTVQYRWDDLTALANHLESKAAELRRDVEESPRSTRSHVNIEKRARACELESLAYMLRNTTLGRAS